MIRWLLLLMLLLAPASVAAQSPVTIGCTGGTLVNCLSVSGAATGGTPAITAVGPDTNISISLVTKGTGSVALTALFSATASTSSGQTTNAQTVAGDLTLVGTGLGHTGGYLGGVMGNVMGASTVTAAGNNGSATFGVYGKYSLSGTAYTPGYLRGGVIGEASGTSDCAVCGIVSDSTNNEAITITAIFGVDTQYGYPASVYSYGLNLKATSHDVYTARGPTNCEVQWSTGMWFCSLTTAITANTTTTSAPAGSLATTSHATGATRLFISDGSKWQNPLN
jgi:hypothetical protein